MEYGTTEADLQAAGLWNPEIQELCAPPEPPSRPDVLGTDWQPVPLYQTRKLLGEINNEQAQEYRAMAATPDAAAPATPQHAPEPPAAADVVMGGEPETGARPDNLEEAQMQAFSNRYRRVHAYNTHI